jgi:hypothetical protein
MRLPMQSQPVQRNINTQPLAQQGDGGAVNGERGVQPSDFLSDLQRGIGVAGQLAGSLGPILGSFGI